MTIIILFVLSSLAPPTPHTHHTHSVEGDEVMLHWTEEGKCRSKSQKSLANGAGRKIPDDLKNLDYFQSQLELFSKMCHGRQYLAIKRVKEQLPIDVVLR